MSEDRLAQIEAAIGALRGDMAGIARNVDIEALGRTQARIISEIATLRDELRLNAATTRQILGMLAGLTDMLNRIVALQERTDDRLRRLEERG